MTAKTPTTITNTSTTIMFNVSPEFLAAIEKFVGEQNVSRASVIRAAVGDYIGYDVSKETRKPRTSKYANEEERKEAMKERAKKRRQLTSKLLAAYEAEDSEEAIKALVASLKNLDEAE